MTYEDLLEAIIERGIAEARRDYGGRATQYAARMLEGAIAGFEACRGKSPAEITALWFSERGLILEKPAESWIARCRQAEIEWVANVISVGLAQQGQPPLLPWQPTVRAATLYAEIIGVKKSAS